MSSPFEVTSWQEKLTKTGENTIWNVLLEPHVVDALLIYCPFHITNAKVGTKAKSSRTRARRKRMALRQIRQWKASPNSNLHL
jgi:hypothetical protein